MQIKQVKKWIKSTLLTSMFSPISNYYQGIGACLMYHRITDDRTYNYERDYYHHGLLTHVDNFDRQMQYLAENYHCLDLPTAIALLAENKLPAKTALVTFDDGYKDNLTLALPILKKYSIPATIYVATGFIECESLLWWYEVDFIVRKTQEINFNYKNTSYHWLTRTEEEKMLAIEEISALIKQIVSDDQIHIMQQLRLLTNDKFTYNNEFLTWEEIIQLDQEPLITIGAHTHNHPHLCILDEETLNRELLLSKQLLEEKLRHPVLHFAYPFGDQQDAQTREFNAAAKAGFSSAVTTRFGHWHREHVNNLFALPRIETHYLDTMPDFIWKMSGWEDCYRNRGKRVRDTLSSPPC